MTVQQTLLPLPALLPAEGLTVHDMSAATNARPDPDAPGASSQR